MFLLQKCAFFILLLHLTYNSFIMSEKMPEIKGMAPYIEVFDMPASLHFYRDILGFELKMSSGEGDDVDWVLLELNNIQLMLNTAYERTKRPAQPDQTRIKGHKDMTFYFGCPDVDALYHYLLVKNVSVKKEPHITIYGWKAIHLRDPDEYGLCFHWPLDNS